MASDGVGNGPPFFCCSIFCFFQICYLFSDNSIQANTISWSWSPPPAPHPHQPLLPTFTFSLFFSPPNPPESNQCCLGEWWLILLVWSCTGSHSSCQFSSAAASPCPHTAFHSAAPPPLVRPCVPSAPLVTSPELLSQPLRGF